MTAESDERAQRRVLVLAPTGRDAPVIVDVLGRAGVAALACPDLEALLREVDDGAGLLLVAYEGLVGDGMRRLAARLRTEPGWSELPVVLMTAGPSASRAWARVVEAFEAKARLTLLERPTSVETLVAAVSFALQSRLRQYAVRDLLDSLSRRTEELRRSNEELDHFAAVASHDLQAPLRRVTMYGDLLRKRHGEALQDEAREFLEHITEGTTRMHAMVTSILSYAQATRSTAPHVRTDLGEVVRDALGDLQERLDERRAVVTVRPLPVVTGDAVQLARVFQNLLANAIRYSEGEPRVVVEARQTPSHHEIRVRDNGIGIAAEDQERIFDLFTQVSEGGTEGFGIGLPTCRRIAERHGGRLTVQSEVGVGSTFILTLPRTDQDPEGRRTRAS